MTWLRILSVEELAAAQRAVEETVSWPGISPRGLLSGPVKPARADGFRPGPA
jgi:hypothetical protein